MKSVVRIAGFLEQGGRESIQAVIVPAPEPSCHYFRTVFTAGFAAAERYSSKLTAENSAR